MEIGFHLTPFWSPTDRNPTQIIDEAIQVVAAASRMGYRWVSIGQHWISHPTVWPQPFPVLARLAPETGSMRLKTSVLLLPIMNAVETAENVATLDHITHGRLDVGVAIGYREKELEVVGLARKDRVAKLEESLALMKRLWAGEEVSFPGDYTKVTAGRMGFTPYQKPHPPLEMGAQSIGATRRAARITDGVFFGPQVAWRDIARLSAVFREVRAETPAGGPGHVGASRSLIVGASKEAAQASARVYLEKTFAMYRSWEMQEKTMAELQLGFDIPLDDWTINGPHRVSPDDRRADPPARGRRRMNVRRALPVALPPAALWKLLWDVPRIVGCVPGCVEAREIEPHRRYAAQMRQKVGPISLSVPLDVTVTEAEPDRRLALQARGRDPVIGAEISMQVTLGIEAKGETSVLHVEAEGRVLGKLGVLGHGVIQRKAEEAMDEFGARLQRAAAG